jgi:hypothetical protein
MALRAEEPPQHAEQPDAGVAIRNAGGTPADTGSTSRARSEADDMVVVQRMLANLGPSFELDV